MLGPALTGGVAVHFSLPVRAKVKVSVLSSEPRGSIL